MKLSGAPPTWDDARALLRELFALVKDTEELAALAFRIPLEGQEIVQWVRVSPISVHGEPWLTVLSDICPHTRITPAQAFEYLKQLPFGGLLLMNDVYVFRHSLSLAYVDRDQLNQTVRLVSHEALRLRVAITPPTQQQVMMSHYDE